MSLRCKITRDEITPSLKRKIAKLKDPTPILRAMGTEIVTITKLSFRNAALRQKAWPAKSTGEASNLIDKGALRSSIHITSLDTKSVTVGTDRKYAAIHQLGGVITPKGKKALVFNVGGKKIFAKKVTIPARPFFPITPAGELTPLAAGKVKKVIVDALA